MSRALHLAPVFMMGLALLVGCEARDHFQGTLHARGGDLGDWDFEPEACYSGQPDAFFGVDLESADGRYRVRFVDDTIDGATVVPFVPGSNTRRSFVPEDCSVFHVEIEETNWYVDDIRVLNGEMDVDCASENGEFFGAVSFEGCH